jgi:hypothetical protein
MEANSTTFYNPSGAPILSDKLSTKANAKQRRPSKGQ